MPGPLQGADAGDAGELTAVAHAGIDDPVEMSEVTATDEKLQPLVDATGGGAFWTQLGGGRCAPIRPRVDVPRISMLANAKVLAGSGWLGLKDREAYRHPRRQADARCSRASWRSPRCSC